MSVGSEGLLQYALDYWVYFLRLIKDFLITPPESFADGEPWEIVTQIFDGLQGVAYALMMICFCIGLLRSSLTFMELKRPSVAITVFLRFLFVKVLIDMGAELLQFFIKVSQEIMEMVFSAGSFATSPMEIPAEIKTALAQSNFMESILYYVIILIAVVVIIVMALTVLMTVCGRFFKIYMAAALAPLPLATLAGESTQSIGFGYLKAFFGLCLEGCVIAIACVIYSKLVLVIPFVNVEGGWVASLLNFIVGTILQTLILAGMVKGADWIVQRYLNL